MRQHRARDIEQAEDIGIEHPLCFRVAGFFYGAKQAVSGVVQQYVDPAKRLNRLTGGFVSLGFIGDVKLDRQQTRIVAKLLGDRGWISRRGDNGVALSQGLSGDPSAKSAGCSCDEPDTHDVSPPFASAICPLG